MNNFSEFIKSNKKKIYKIAESNTFKNIDNIPSIEKDDTWREEIEWDEISKKNLEDNIEAYEELSKK